MGCENTMLVLFCKMVVIALSVSWGIDLSFKLWKGEESLGKTLDDAWWYFYQYRLRYIQVSTKLLEDLTRWSNNMSSLRESDRFPYREKVDGLSKQLNDDLVNLIKSEKSFKTFKGVSDRDLGLGLVEGVRAIDTYQLTQNHVETIKVDTAKWFANTED